MDAYSISLILLIISFHWIADFVLQTEWQATNKSKNIKALIAHTTTYSTFWLPVSLIFFDFSFLNSLAFVGITFLFHTATDYLTSKLNTRLVTEIRKEQIEAFQKGLLECSPQENFLNSIGKGKWHNFFVSVGFDQVLHYAQLFLTYYLLKS